jgi:hypothetical protein
MKEEDGHALFFGLLLSHHDGSFHDIGTKIK